MRNRLALLLALALPTVALAHAMRLTVTVTATEVRVEVKYDGADHGGGGPTVELFRMPAKELVEKKPADKAGACVFAKPEPGTYLVVVGDEFHDAEKLIEVTANELAVYEDGPGNKWLLIAAGVTMIAVLTAAGWYFSKPKGERGA